MGDVSMENCLQILDVFVSACGLLLAFLVYRKQFKGKCKCECHIVFYGDKYERRCGIAVKIVNTGNLPIGILEVSALFEKKGIELQLLGESKRLDVGEYCDYNFAPTKEQYKYIFSNVNDKDEKISIVVKTSVKTYILKTDKSSMDIQRELQI